MRTKLGPPNPATSTTSTALTPPVPASPSPKAILDKASDRLIALLPEALSVIETQLRTFDPDTKRDLALRIIDETGVSPKAKARLGLGGDVGDALSPLLASALRGAFQGLGDALGVKVPAPTPPLEPRNVTPSPVPASPVSRVRPALSKGESHA